MSEEQAVRVHVELPNHELVAGESFWADPVAEDLYRLSNIPFYAYGLNFQDLVRAIPGPGGVLEIQALVEASGHRTLRVLFPHSVPPERQTALLEALAPFGAEWERPNSRVVAVSVRPSGDYLAVFDQLDSWANEGLVGFETCQERVAGSFDDEPQAS